MQNYSKCTASFKGSKQRCEQIEAWLLSQDAQSAPTRRLLSMDGRTASEDNDKWEITFNWQDMLGTTEELLEGFRAAGVRQLEINQTFK